MNDINLFLDGFRHGDPHCFNKIYKHFHASIFYLVQHLVKDLPEAQDITSDTFIKLWAYHARLESIQHIQGFLLVTARNACLDHLRWKQRRQVMEAQLKYFLEKDNLIMEREITPQELSLIYRKLETLPYQPREILKMRLTGKEPIEIAEILGMPRGQVDVQMSIGMRRLRNILRIP